MILNESTPLAADRLPIAELRRHLRLGTGFGEDTVQDEILERCLRAALARIEALTGRSILRRNFTLAVWEWRLAGRQPLSRAPIERVVSFALIGPDDVRREVPRSAYHVAGGDNSAVVARGFSLPGIPVGGRAEIVFEAGLAPDWMQMPADLGFAILTQAAALYEDRVGSGDMPAGVAEAIAPWRCLRMGGRA